MSNVTLSPPPKSGLARGGKGKEIKRMEKEWARYQEEGGGGEESKGLGRTQQLTRGKQKREAGAGKSSVAARDR